MQTPTKGHIVTHQSSASRLSRDNNHYLYGVPFPKLEEYISWPADQFGIGNLG